MAYLIQPLFESIQLTNAAAVIYTSTAVRTQVQQFSLVNTAGASHTATVWWVPSGGGSPGAANLILPTTTLLAGQVLNVLGLIGQTLAAGDKVYAQADVGAVVNAFASGLVMS